MSERRILQISAVGVENNIATQCNTIVFALCDDGTVWRNDDHHREWWHLDPIPQPVSPPSPAPLPRPTVEQLVEIGRNAVNAQKQAPIGHRIEMAVQAIADAVFAADAPAVALPEGLLERLPSDFMVNAMDETRCGAWLDAEYIKAIRELIEWARTLPTAPAITEGVREKAREIAYCVPASELMERFVEDGGHRPFGGVTFRRAIADACSLIRELAAGGTP